MGIRRCHDRRAESMSGTYHRFKRRVDVTHRPIIEALLAVGATVQSLHTIGKGCPDLLVGFRGQNYLFEVKRDEKAALTPDECNWHLAWKGQNAVVWDVVQAVELLFELDGKSWP